MLPETLTPACFKTSTVIDGDACFNLYSTNDLPAAMFYELNPGIDCNNLQIGQKVCIRGGITGLHAALPP